MIATNDDDLATLVEGYRNPLLLCFIASWCPICRTMKGPYTEVAATLRGRLLLVTADAETCPRARAQHCVSVVPTQLLLIRGHEAWRKVGSLSPGLLVAELQKRVERGRASIRPRTKARTVIRWYV